MTRWTPRAHRLRQRALMALWCVAVGASFLLVAAAAWLR